MSAIDVFNGDADGLCALQVRVARNQDFDVLLAKADKRPLKIADFGEQRVDFIAQPEAHVERDLVVARATGVEFRAGGHTPRQFRLDVHVDVF